MDAAIAYIGARVRFEDFYEAEHDRVFRVVLAFSGSRDLAQEATQEAFARAYSRWRRLSEADSPAGWVITTATNHCRRALRRPRPGPIGARQAPAPSGDRLDVARALLALPERQRQAVVLFHLGDEPLTRVAELMGVSEGAVKAHLDRARKKLRTALEVKHV